MVHVNFVVHDVNGIVNVCPKPSVNVIVEAGPAVDVNVIVLRGPTQKKGVTLILVQKDFVLVYIPPGNVIENVYVQALCPVNLLAFKANKLPTNVGRTITKRTILAFLIILYFYKHIRFANV